MNYRIVSGTLLEECEKEDWFENEHIYNEDSIAIPEERYQEMKARESKGDEL